jgi:hypothetical protein
MTEKLTKPDDSVVVLSKNVELTDTRTLIGYFVASRLLLFAFHVNMRTDSLNSMHFADPAALSYNYFETLLRDPAQPPGMQILTSLLQLIAPGNIMLPALIFNTTLGLMATLCLRKVLLTLDVPRKIALYGSVAFFMSPATILFERQYWYPHIIISLIIIGLFCVTISLKSPTFRNWLIAMTCFAIPCWLHAFFHPIYLIAIILTVILINPSKSLACAVVLPLIIASAPTIKNGMLYKVWASSDWAPYSLTNIASYHTITPRERQQLRADGLETSLTALEPFATRPERYFGNSTIWKPSGLPALDNPYKTNGEINWHAVTAIPAGARLKDENIAIIKRFPEAYIRGIQGAIYFYMKSPSQWFWSKNRDRIIWYDRLWSLITTGTLNEPSKPTYVSFRAHFATGLFTAPQSLYQWGTTFGFDKFPFLSIAFLPVLFVWGIYKACTSIIKSDQHAAIWGLMLIICCYVTAISVLLELGENQRFRAYIGVILLIWVTTLTVHLYNLLGGSCQHINHKS